MNGLGPPCSFGPVPSRRLGRSLGINNIPPKACTYSCVYCQLGRTRPLRIGRRAFFGPATVFEEVRTGVERAEKRGDRIDYLSFVPDGEPTLDRDLGEEISRLKVLGLPIAVITNASLIGRRDVRAALRNADWVSLKVDTVREQTWRRLDRPHRALSLTGILEGMLEFAGEFAGKLVTETMLVEGLNTTEADFRELGGFLSRLRPSKAFLGIPTRPPAEPWVRGPDERTLGRAFITFAEKVERVEYLIGYEGNAFAFTGDVEKDILSITAVHPMRKEAMDTLLSRAGAAWAVIDGMLRRGDLAAVEYEGHTFYMRRFAKPAGLRTPPLEVPA